MSETSTPSGGGYFGKEVPKLGFGLMRLPNTLGIIDVEQVKTMVDMFIEAGFTYFDTAFVYPGSEAAIKKALVDRYPRDSYTLATKLNASVALTEKAAKQQFHTSLERTGAGYFDYYLLHAFMENNYERYEKFDLWDYVRDLKAKGLVKHYGFSFHAGPSLLDKILTDHPDVDFVQLQINYADWENKSIASRANYEVARRHGKSITVMEPVKGGKLADPPKEIKKLFTDYNPDASCASWAIRFVASLDGIITVLSGMSNIAQMKDNISYMKDFVPLNAEERAIIRRASEIMCGSSAIPCTACRYCVGGCPMSINIPAIFSALNSRVADGQIGRSAEEYASATEGGGAASDCIECRQCEDACPQHLPITDHLKKAAEIFGR
ncbi:MAG: aldo/keto reductase [Clostridia bacterium]|nr:aldo/keto reductase [Clostridia bacterium]